MKFGVLCNGEYLQKWQAESIEILIKNGHECVLFIENDNIIPRKSIAQKITQYPIQKWLVHFWTRFLLKPDSKNIISRHSLNTNAEVVKCETNQKAYSQYFNENDVKFIHSKNLDFILRYGFSIIKGDILDSAKYGIWSYHHDDDQKYRGVPTGFWEILYSDPVNAAILQRLTDKIDSGHILHKAYFATVNHSWKANLDRLLFHSTEWPSLVCKKIESGNTDFLEKENKPSSPIYKLPRNSIMIKFLIKVFVNKLKFHWKDLFRAEMWRIGIVSTAFETWFSEGEIEIPQIDWIKGPDSKSAYYADPSLMMTKNSGLQVLCEEYDYKVGVGEIRSLKIDEQFKVIDNNITMPSHTHLAFPYSFEWENDWYCIPENSGGNCIELYKLNQENNSFYKVKTLLEDIKAVDAALYFHQDYWWLFFTDIQSTNERLNIWYSKHLTEDYKPHLLNPVKTDVRTSRPAGKPFIMDGTLYRPAQDCSLRSGWRVQIMKVEELTPTSFEESPYSILRPPENEKWINGMHTFNVNEGMIIIDAKEEKFVYAAFRAKLKQKLSRIFNR